MNDDIELQIKEVPGNPEHQQKGDKEMPEGGEKQNPDNQQQFLEKIPEQIHENQNSDQIENQDEDKGREGRDYQLPTEEPLGTDRPMYSEDLANEVQNQAGQKVVAKNISKKQKK